MVNPVQPVRSTRLEPTRLEPAGDRAPLASSAVTGPAAPPALSPPATIVELSDAVFARQRGVNPGRSRAENRRRLEGHVDAREEADRALLGLLGDGREAKLAQATLSSERVYALLFE